MKKTKNYVRFEIGTENLSVLPQKCGVYLFRNSQGEIIYVGKAINIQKRVKSHFTHRDLSPFRKEMLEETKVINYLLTTDEHEALMLEEELIKAHKPQYNLRSKDDKSYPYIRVSAQGTFPSITFSRKRMGKEGYYFGPFTNTKKVREGIKILRTLFLLRSCEIPESRFPLQRPCIEYNLRLCSAPCVGYISQEAYHTNLEKALDFLNGNYDSVMKWLEEEMWKAANVLDFETAAFYRNRLEAAKEIATRYRLVLPQPDDVDFLEAACGNTLSVVT
ncbi:MAG: GIY-YIG nuclease family protein, partial [Candidatus Caldatribacteriaceae bacterium]